MHNVQPAWSIGTEDDEEIADHFSLLRVGQLHDSALLQRVEGEVYHPDSPFDDERSCGDEGACLLALQHCGCDFLCFPDI